MRIAQMLIEKGASIKALDRYGYTALHYAARPRLGASISRLLEMGAHINETNVFGSNSAPYGDTAPSDSPRVC